MKKKMIALLMAMLLCVGQAGWAETLFDLTASDAPASELEEDVFYDEELFRDLTEGLEKLEESELALQEAEYMLPLDCGLLTETNFGTCSLLQHRYQLEGIAFSAYAFDRTNPETVALFAEQNVNGRHYELEVRNINGCEFYVLTQFGREARKAMIAPDFNGYTLLLVEEGLETANAPEVIPAKYVTCTYCEGDGECTSSNCNSGKCAACGGIGFDECIICEGSGDCQHCDGIGMRFSTYSSRICSGCDGSGDCQFCDGKGYKDEYSHHECFTCDGSGNCRTCNGTGMCVSCGGDGNSAN